MALSKTVMTSQEVLSCRFCQVTTKIAVKCMDCNIFMCNDCSVNKHSIFKDANLHKVIDIKHIASFRGQNPERFEFKRVKCKKHMDNIFYMYCSECKEMVCQTCISNKHKRHALEEIENVCLSEKEVFNRSCAQMDSKIEQCLETTKTSREVEYSKYQEIKRKTKDEEKRALEKVHEEFTCKLNILDKKWEEYERQFSNKRETLTKEQQEIHTLRSEFLNAFDQRNPELILKITEKLEARCKSFLVPPLELIPFCLQRDTSDIIDIRLSLERHFTIKSVGTISNDHENFIWIASDTNIWKIDPLSAETVETYDAPRNLIEIRCTRSVGTSLLVAAGTQLHILTYRGSFAIFSDFEPCEPSTIHISKVCQIVVGMKFLDENKPVIVVLGTDGKKLKEYMNIKRRLLNHTAVQCCTSLEDGSICYNDTDSMLTTGRTIKLDEKGGVQWIYRGHGEFCPVEVLATKLNNIVVSEAIKRCLHILSDSGDLMRLIDLFVFEIDEPVAMTSDDNNCLWTASGSNLHCFKMIGF